MSTRPPGVRAPLSGVPNVDGETGQSEDYLPSVGVIQGVRLQYATLQGSNGPGFLSLFELNDGNLVSRAEKGVYIVSGTGVLWIPEDAKDLQLRLLVYTRRGEGGHCGKDATMDRLHHLWYGGANGKDVETFINDCIKCVDFSRRGKAPRPFGETIDGTEVKSCLRSGYLYIGTGVETFHQISQMQANCRAYSRRCQGDGEHVTRLGGKTWAANTPLR